MPQLSTDSTFPPPITDPVIDLSRNAILSATTTLRWTFKLTIQMCHLWTTFQLHDWGVMDSILMGLLLVLGSAQKSVSVVRCHES